MEVAIKIATLLGGVAAVIFLIIYLRDQWKRLPTVRKPTIAAFGIGVVLGIVILLAYYRWIAPYRIEQSRIDLASMKNFKFGVLTPAKWPGWMVDPFLRSLEAKGKKQTIRGVLVSPDVPSRARPSELQITPILDNIRIDGYVLLESSNGLTLLPKPLLLKASRTLFVCVPPAEEGDKFYAILEVGSVPSTVTQLSQTISLDIRHPDICRPGERTH